MRYSNYSVMETFNQYSFKYTWFVFCFSNTLAKKQQRTDCTAWTSFLMVFNYYSWYCVHANQLPTPTFYYMHQCQDSLIQCSTSRCFVSIIWIYSCVMNNRTSSTCFGTVHQHVHCFDVSRGLGDRVRLKLITQRNRELVPHVCSYHMFK